MNDVVVADNDEDWISNEKYQKLLFHYGELEKQHRKSLATIASLNEEKKRLEHLVIQLQSETETIGTILFLYKTLACFQFFPSQANT